MGAATGASPQTQAVLEDVEWIARSGGTLEEAAARTGRNPGTIQKILTRAERHDLLSQLRNARPGWRDYLAEESLDATRRPCRRTRVPA